MAEYNGDEILLCQIFVCLGRLVRVGIILVAIAIVVLAVWGLCATGVALARGEAWAAWVTGCLILVAFAIMLREIMGW